MLAYTKIAFPWIPLTIILTAILPLATRTSCKVKVIFVPLQIISILYYFSSIGCSSLFFAVAMLVTFTG